MLFHPFFVLYLGQDYTLMRMIVTLMEFVEFLVSPLGRLAIAWTALYFLLHQLLPYGSGTTALLASTLLLVFAVEPGNE
ncbi:MAG: hypothetical protein Fur0046_37120 [Cyanobacteria bacterium J069]|nr:MAG: hypothetical protein D6742_04790 [Cyanobacteria bacterium J069]